MKKLLCIAVIGLTCVLGCAPSDNGDTDDSDTTSQIKIERVENVLANV